MSEILRKREITASETEIKQAVEGWWAYLDRKIQVHPHLAKGIIPRLVDDEGLHSEETRTVKFSLVDAMAPELSGFGKLVNAKTPHVYVEGTRDSNTVVRLNEIVFRDTSKEKPIFTVDRKYIFPIYLWHTYNLEGVSLNRFLLYLYAANDLDQYGKAYESTTAREMVFFTTEDERMHAYDLKGGWRAFRLIKPWLNRYIDKSVSITPATQTQIAIVQEGFRDAILKLGSS